MNDSKGWVAHDFLHQIWIPGRGDLSALLGWFLVTFKHHSSIDSIRIWDPPASYSRLRDLQCPQGISTGKPSSQQIDLDLESNETCLRDVFSLSVCSMNAILACFDVLVVLTLKLAKMAFIGQKLTIIRKQHKYWPLYEIAVHGLSILSLGNLWYFYGNVIYIQLDFRKRTEKNLPANWWEKGKKAVFLRPMIGPKITLTKEKERQL